MTHLDEASRTALVREIALTLARKQRLASDFHAFAEGRTLTLAGVTFDAFPKGPNTKRSDGDVVAHAIVMALAAAVNKGDIDDWFPDKGEIGVRSIDYLPEMHHNIAEGLGIDRDQVHVKVSSMDGQDEVARLEGIEARVLVSLWEGL